jgi:hypothetical protein
VELGLGGNEPRVYAALARDPIYPPLFAAAFPGESERITTSHIAAARYARHGVDAMRRAR